MKITTVERELKEQGRCLIQTVGVSMEPVLHDRFSTVVVEKLNAPPKLFDVVLFKRSPQSNAEAGEQYVLHRVIKVGRGEYIIRGDNCIQNEKVAPDQILGVMTGFFNGETFVDCKTDKAYLRYLKTLQVRYIARWCRAFPNRAVRKLKRSFS